MSAVMEVSTALKAWNRSGSISPTLSKSGTPTNIATAYVEDALAAVGTELSFVVRDKA